MSSSATGATGRDSGDGTDGGPVTLHRTVERLDQGIVVTYELTAEADTPVAVDLTQPLPDELAMADVGFRTDAAPGEWSVDGETVHGTGTVPDDEAVEYVLGLKLPEAPDRLPTFPEPDLSDADAGTAAADATADSEPGAAAESDDDTEPEAGASTAATDETPDDEGTDTGDDDGPALVGNTDGALAESVRQVIGDDSDEGNGTPGTAATDGGPETVGAGGSGDTPAPRGTPEDTDSGLEAAVAAVESELDEAADDPLSAGNDTADEDPPELDLSPPEPDAAEGDEEAETTEKEGGAAEEPDAGGSTADAPHDGESTGTTAAAGARVDELADRLAAADEADQRAIRSALGLDDEGGADHGGTVTVRLEQLESRLSAFEAYEDALADFIEDTGTVESVAATATEAAEAAEELQAEVADLREEVAAARESVEEASEERAALREDVAALRADVEEARGLRQQLLGALQNAGSTDDAASGSAGGGE
ncbi:hypothetical protein [Haloglomus salinum]|uniref:hypothetical protein n=1 Tax=Haloglomus salinum TaxID=2962673 RepID=UPI0020C9415C|nr:hypothetical protein [Haloglomus salinum]